MYTYDCSLNESTLGADPSVEAPKLLAIKYTHHLHVDVGNQNRLEMINHDRC